MIIKLQVSSVIETLYTLQADRYDDIRIQIKLVLIFATRKRSQRDERRMILRDIRDRVSYFRGIEGRGSVSRRMLANQIEIEFPLMTEAAGNIVSGHIERPTAERAEHDDKAFVSVDEPPRQMGLKR